MAHEVGFDRGGHLDVGVILLCESWKIHTDPRQVDVPARSQLSLCEHFTGDAIGIGALDQHVEHAVVHLHAIANVHVIGEPIVVDAGGERDRRSCSAHGEFDRVPDLEVEGPVDRPVRIDGPCRSTSTETSRPASSEASRILPTTSAHQSCVAWLMFSRRTFAPASMSERSCSRDCVAGPIVQMIFVFRIPVPYTRLVREPTRNAEMQPRRRWRRLISFSGPNGVTLRSRRPLFLLLLLPLPPRARLRVEVLLPRTVDRVPWLPRVGPRL